MRADRSIGVTLVRLKSGEYSVPAGSLGYIEDLIGENACWVRWAEQPGPGGGSGPIILDDLEQLGGLYVLVPRELIDEEIARAESDIPGWLVRARARRLLRDLAERVDADELFEEAGVGIRVATESGLPVDPDQPY